MGGSFWNRARFWIMKLITTTYMLILPSYFHQSIAKGLALFVLGHFTCGEVLATMFIVNHVIEGVAYARKNTEETVSNDDDDDKDKDNDKENRPCTAQGSTPMIE